MHIYFFPPPTSTHAELNQQKGFQLLLVLFYVTRGFYACDALFTHSFANEMYFYNCT